MNPEGSPPGVPAYASTKLIAYLGNKRALLPFLLPVFLELDAERPVSSFLDPFAGSGAVSRLARSLGWRVMANDAEEYSRAVNEAWLGLSPGELPGLFAEEGGLDAALGWLNALHPSREDRSPGCPVEPYIARHYAPSSTEGADWRRERLFYTRENAVFIDRVRCAIEALHPKAAGASAGGSAEGPGRRRFAERALLLGALVYEAATHANTSGVFKAYHKGFGGHGRDALGRILCPMRLERPLLWEAPPAELGQEDAAAFCSGRPAELCYLDPPYNQHQYGSNYHLLNTIARWDRLPVSEERDADGFLLSAAGIPSGWRESRSAFCSRSAAPEAFRRLLSAIDARSILLSYNTEGFVPAGELVELLSDRAEVSMRSLDYIKYRGGRQSSSRRLRNREILFVARRRESPGKPVAETASAAWELAELDADLRLARALAGPFDPRLFLPLCGASGCLRFESGGLSLDLRSYKGLVLEDGEGAYALGREGRLGLAALLEQALLRDNASACAAATLLIEEGESERRLQDLALGWLRKIAHRGYEAEFRALAARLREAASGKPEPLRRLAEGVAGIELVFGARLEARRRHGGASQNKRTSLEER